MEFQAKIHGIEVKGSSDHAPRVSEDPAVPMFRDPKEYENLSQQEKENMTKQMIGKHKKWNEKR